MTTELAQQSPALPTRAAFEAHLAASPELPEWLLKRKRAAWERFAAAPMPTRKSEPWRFATVSGLDLDSFHAPESREAPAPVELPLGEVAGRMLFADDRCVSHAVADLPEGVIFEPLSQALHTHPEMLREYLLRRFPDLGSEKFQALHEACFRDGVLLYVPRGTVVERPFAVHHRATQAGVGLLPHTLFIVDETAQATLVEFFDSETLEKHCAIAASEVFAGPSANLRYKAVQNWNGDALAFHLNTISAQRDAQVKAITINMGGAHVRGEQHSRIFGAGANVDMDSLSIATGTQEIDQRTLQTHAAPNATSDLLYKNVLLDDARTIFSGLIKVEEDAQQTDAYQTNRNLLLSGTADANSLPGLEILANDVKCSHGATTGQIDPEELFYLLARGIPARKAQELLTFGFFEEIIGMFENEELADYVRGLVRAKFLQ